VTERELRELVEPLTQRHIVTGDVRKFRGRLKTALADDPDLVGLLRWAYSQKREHEGLVREARKKTHSPLPEANALYWQIVHDEGGLVHTYGLVIEEIEKVVRLTDGGYEWTD